MYIGLTGKYSLFLSNFLETRIFWTDFRKSQISNFIKIRPVGAELFRAVGRTERWRDMTRLIVAFRSCANAPINVHEELGCNSLTSTKRECLNSSQDGANASKCTGIIPQNSDTVKPLESAPLRTAVCDGISRGQ
jgi:hypothetical protein